MPSNTSSKKRLVEHSKSLIISMFFEEFENIFTDNEPNWNKIKVIFQWLREEAKNARYFSDINAIDKCRRISESHFSRIKIIEARVRKESKRVNHELRRRFDELRTTKKGAKKKILSVLTYEHKHDKVPPSR